MSKRAAAFASLLVLLSPAQLWSAHAEDGPVATAPIPPPVPAAPDHPVVVPLKPSGEAKPNAEVKSLPAPKHETTAHPTVSPSLRNGAQPEHKAAASRPGLHPEKKADEAKKAEEKKTAAAKKADETKKAEAAKKREAQARAGERRRAVVRRRWFVQERRWEPPPPFGPSWYQRYPPFTRVVPPPMSWDD